MSRSVRIRPTGLVVAVVVLVAAVVVTVVLANDNSGKRQSSPPTGPPLGNGSTSSNTLTEVAATPTLVTDPSVRLDAAQIALLRQVASRTWAFLSGPDLDPVTHLSRKNVRLSGQPSPSVGTAPPGAGEDFTSPTEIGLYLTSIVAARDLGLMSAAQAEGDAAAQLAELQRLQTADEFLLRWYSTSTGQAIQTPTGVPATTEVLSSVDDSWMAQGLLVASRAFPSLPGFASLLSAMQYPIFYDQAKNAMYNTYTVGLGPSTATYNLAYGGPRIGDYIAIGSGAVPGQLWYGLQRTPASSTGQRQAPEGVETTYVNPQDRQQSFDVFEGSYVYDQIRSSQPSPAVCTRLWHPPWCSPNRPCHPMPWVSTTAILRWRKTRSAATSTYPCGDGRRRRPRTIPGGTRRAPPWPREGDHPRQRGDSLRGLPGPPGRPPAGDGGHYVAHQNLSWHLRTGWFRLLRRHIYRSDRGTVHGGEPSGHFDGAR